MSAGLVVKKRTDTGKRYCKKLRANKQLPGIIYGLKKEAVPVEFSLEDLLVHLQNKEKVFNVNIDNKEEHLIVKEIQYDTLEGKFYHVDFYRIELDKKVKVKVPVNFIGVPKGTKMGGRWRTAVEEISISCLPDDIPKSIPVNVENIGLNEKIKIKELKLSDKVTIEEKPEKIITGVFIKKGRLKEEEKKEEEAKEKVK